MPRDVELGVACPDGDLATAVRRLGLPVYAIPAISASFRLHPVRTARAAIQVGSAALAVHQISERHGASVIHANSVRAGLIARLAGTFSGLPAVVHVRDVLPESVTGLAVRRSLIGRSITLIAISDYVKQKFGVAGRGIAMTVIDNPVDQRRFDVRANTIEESREALGVAPGVPLIGIVGQISPWKGHDTAIRALGLLRARYPDVTLAIVGEVKFSEPGTSLDNRAFLDGLRDLVHELGLADKVIFFGERDDIPRVMRALDVLLVPSTAEPFGRTVAEAMTMATPVIATCEGGPSELIDDGVTGLLAPPGDSEAWRCAIDRLLSDRPAADQMAQASRRIALNRFDVARHTRSVLAVLETAVSRRQ